MGKSLTWDREVQYRTQPLLCWPSVSSGTTKRKGYRLLHHRCIVRRNKRKGYGTPHHRCIVRRNRRKGYRTTIIGNATTWFPRCTGAGYSSSSKRIFGPKHAHTLSFFAFVVPLTATPFVVAPYLACTSSYRLGSQGSLGCFESWWAYRGRGSIVEKREIDKISGGVGQEPARIC